MKKPIKKIKVYLSGKITGLPNWLPEILFEQAEHDVRSMYSHVKITIVNPIKIKHKRNAKWEDFMAKDIEELLFCDEIFMLDNWRSSKGARIEHFIAEEMKKPIQYQKQVKNYKKGSRKLHKTGYITTKGKALYVLK